MINYTDKLSKWYDDTDYMYVGIRFQDVPMVAGEVIDHHSHVIDYDGNVTDEELPGTCVLTQGAEKMAHGYEWMNHIAIVGYDDIEYGQDYGEHIAKNPVVLEVLK